MVLPVKSRRINDHTSIELLESWHCARVTPGSGSFDSIQSTSLDWLKTQVPSTVAQSAGITVSDVGLFDQDEWWYRTEFDLPEPDMASNSRWRLRFEGLATLAQVWLNGNMILETDNMFREYVVDVSAALQSSNQLLIRFKSLAEALDQKKPRPRWKTALVNHQNLRWYRTTLLGRIPAWCPPVNPVGPWRPVTLERVDKVDLLHRFLRAWLEGDTGHVVAEFIVDSLGQPIEKAELIVNDARFALDIGSHNGNHVVSGRISIAAAPVWWPHTHGAPGLVSCVLQLHLTSGVVAVDCGKIGFKSISLEDAGGKLRFIVNGQPVFCRGACWTVDDFIAITGSVENLRSTLQLARDANINMLRIGGTMVYEQDAFYELCDELGIMVWQDFMFANMDYPFSDPVFASNVEDEIRQQLHRLQSHVCIAAYCGGSEIQQQAAMMGLPAADWSNAFFEQALPSLCNALHPGVPYVTGSPTGGDLPFHPGAGFSHYYGVGAYRRALTDVKHAGVKFASECLGISNVPEPVTMDLLLAGRTPPPHHPVWKQRVARDNGSAYDFEDVRDFYLAALYQVDPSRLRWEHVEHYYALSRTVSGEVMLRTFAEWRRSGNPCSGGLVWFYKDLWPGAGWGVLDSQGHPKAAYHFLKRAWASQAVFILDDGLDGVRLLVINEKDEPLHGLIEFGSLQHARTCVLKHRHEVHVGARQQIELSVDALLGRFTDCNYVYRFGPPSADVLFARLADSAGNAVLSEDVYFPLQKPAPLQDLSVMKATVEWQADGNVVVMIAADALLQDVWFDCDGFTPDLNHFHVVPGREYRVVFAALSNMSAFKTHVGALNLPEPVTLRARQ